MKRWIALFLSVMALCAAFAAPALAQEPLYATVGDALAAAGEIPVAGGEDGYYAVVTQVDGRYYRSVAETDEKYSDLQSAVWEAEPDQIEAAFAAADEYLRTLPIAYTEAFTAEPMTQAEMDALVGKTIGELRQAGYEDRESGTEGDGIVYVMRNGLFDYACAVDADFDAYEQAQEEWPDGGNDFAILGVTFRGITGEACLKRFNTDGTVEELPDPFAGYTDLIAAIQEMVEAVQGGENVDTEAFFNDLKAAYPNLADTVDMYMGLYDTLGAETLAGMLASED